MTVHQFLHDYMGTIEDIAVTSTQIDDDAYQDWRKESLEMSKCNSRELVTIILDVIDEYRESHKRKQNGYT